MGSEFGIFGVLRWVRSSVLVGKPGFERVRSSTSRVRSSSKFVIFGFDPTLELTNLLKACGVQYLIIQLFTSMHFLIKT